MTTTKAILDLQSDLTQPNTPSALTDIANKDYVDTVAGAIADATSGSGGATKGITTFDSDFGLETVPAGVARVRLDTTRGVAFNAGQIQAKVSTAEGTAFNGSGEIAAKVSNPEGIEFNGSGEIAARVDGSTIVFDGGGNLQATSAAVPDATAGSGDTGTLGKVRADSDQGLDINGVGTMFIKADPATLQFNGSGELEVIGGVGTTGDTSHRIALTRDITAITAPTPGSIGTEIDTLDHPDAVTTGQRFEFEVPDDYHQGTLELLVVYQMSTAVAAPNNQIRVTTAAEIVDVSTGTIDAASYPETGQDLTVPDNTTDIVRQTLLAIAPGDFSGGDTIEFYVKRIGGDVNDLHTGDWQVISYELRYETVVDQRIAVSRIEFIDAALSFNPAPPDGTLIGSTEITTKDFTTGTDLAIKCGFVVPDNWDGTSDCIVLLTYAMTTAAANVVRLTGDFEIADVVGGSIVTPVQQILDLSVSADTNPHRIAAFTISPADLAKGDDVTFILQRLGTAVQDTHGGDFQLVSILAVFTIAPSSGFNQVTVDERYLATPVFGNISGALTNTIDYPLFGTTFDTYTGMVSGSPAGRVDVAFHGRLSQAQTLIGRIRVNIYGVGASPQYRLKVYAEGSGATPVYDSGLLAASASPVQTDIIGGALSAQPVSQKRFVVVVEAYLDAGEELHVSYPFVRQE